MWVRTAFSLPYGWKLMSYGFPPTLYAKQYVEWESSKPTAVSCFVPPRTCTLVPPRIYLYTSLHLSPSRDYTRVQYEKQARPSSCNSFCSAPGHQKLSTALSLAAFPLPHSLLPFSSGVAGSKGELGDEDPDSGRLSLG